MLYLIVMSYVTSMSAAVGHQLCLKTLLTDKFRGDFRCDPALTLLKYVFMLISIIHWTVILSSILAGYTWCYFSYLIGAVTLIV